MEPSPSSCSLSSFQLTSTCHSTTASKTNLQENKHNALLQALRPLVLATLASSLAVSPSASSSRLEARQGKFWNIMTGSEECGSKTANACIVRGGDPTVADDKNPRFSNGNVCQGQTASFQSKFGHPEAQAAGAANPHCVITAKINDSCKINGRSGAQEINLKRNTVKTTALGTPETQGDVEFSGSCGMGTFIGSEIRIV